MARPWVTAMAGVTIACPEPNRLIRLATDVLGWEVFCSERIDDEQQSSWGIASQSSGKTSTILRSRGTDRGMIRLVEGPKRVYQSPMKSRWSGIEIVVTKDLDRLSDKLSAHSDFEVQRPILKVDFTHAGANIHDFFYGYALGDAHIMFTMAETQPETYAFPDSPNPVGHIFDVHLEADSSSQSQEFYEGTIGMKMVFDDTLNDSMFCDTWGLSRDTPKVRMSIFKGDADGFGLGGIELRSYDSATIDPSSAIEDRFDGGVCMTSFTVKDIDGLYAVLRDSPLATVLSKPQVLNRAPYAGGRAFSALGPQGERLEFSERWSA